MRPIARWSALLSLPVAFAAGCADDPGSPSEPGRAEVVAEANCAPLPTDGILMEIIQGMEAQVEGLESAGIVNAGQARALGRHLTNAERQAKRGEYCAARDQLTAFREQLDDFAGEGAISDRDAYDLRHATRLALSTEVVQPGDPNEYAPGVTGELRTVEFGGEQLRVEVIDGLAIFNGDVILGFADELGGGAAAGGPQPTGPCRGCGEWTETIKFSYADDWGLGSTNAAMRDRVLQAVNHWRENTGFSFEVDRADPDVVFRNSMGCSSPVGRKPLGIGPQYINISTGCGRAAIIHEIGHTIGLWHEQSRMDRDDFVKVNLEFVREGREFNFDQYGNAGWDLGSYDYRSIMHYGCDDFRRASAAGSPIEILDPAVTCADIGTASGLSDGDIAGAYVLDEIEYRIVGASNGDVDDRFELAVEFTTEPVADRFLVWVADGVGRIGSGPTLSTVDAGLPEGSYVIRAQIIIYGVLIGNTRLEVTIANTPPGVTLEGPTEAEENRTFTVTARVSDAEDGSCAPPVCTYTWDPVPETDRGGAADYRFFETGPQTISVTVTDGAGAVGDDEIEVSIVNSPPTVVIETPPSGSVFSSGSIVGIRGSATDPNVGYGPGPGSVPCFSGVFSWSSSDPTDVIDLTDACNGTLAFGDPGPRTLTLEVDYLGQTASTSVTLQVEGCGASGCAPTVSFDFDTPSVLDGSRYTPTFTGPGYLLDTAIQATGLISDPDNPPGTITFEWLVRPPCFGGCDPFVVDSGSVLFPAGSGSSDVLTWTPSSDPRVTDYWPTCTTTALPFVISLVATDGNGNSRTFSRTVYLACELI